MHLADGIHHGPGCVQNITSNCDRQYCGEDFKSNVREVDVSDIKALKYESKLIGEYLLEQARNVIREDELDIDILKVIKTSDSVYEARQAVEQGAEVVLARGVQAAFIRQYTNIPVAELSNLQARKSVL